MSLHPSIHLFSEHVVLLQWEKRIDPSLHKEILQWEIYIKNTFANVIVECVVSYQELAVFLQPTANVLQFINSLKKYTLSESPKTAVTNCYTIPVCYVPSFAIDMDTVSAQTGLTSQQIISLHTSCRYRIYFTGFLPGFPYLGGLPEALAVQRKKTPRAIVDAGSVGLAGNQTGIYPTASPGGWQIIGKTPLRFFNVQNGVFYKPGDSIKFTSIAIDEYIHIDNQCRANRYTIKKEELYG